ERERGHVEPFDGGDLTREEALLDLAGEAHLLLEPLLVDPRGEAARVLDGGEGEEPERREELDVVALVGPARPLRAEEEDAARLLAHPEREDELEAGLAEGGPLRRRLLVEQEEAGLRAEAADGLGAGLGGVAARDAGQPAVLLA